MLRKKTVWKTYLGNAIYAWSMKQGETIDEACYKCIKVKRELFRVLQKNRSRNMFALEINEDIVYKPSI